HLPTGTARGSGGCGHAASSPIVARIAIDPTPTARARLAAGPCHHLHASVLGAIAEAIFLPRAGRAEVGDAALDVFIGLASLGRDLFIGVADLFLALFIEFAGRLAGLP